MTSLNKGNYLSLIFLLPAFISCRAQVNIYDGFEKPELSKIWSPKKLAPHALVIQSTIVRSGQSAAKITVHTGDIYEAGRTHPTERDELLEGREELESVEDEKYAYSFSLFIPADFPIVPTRLVIAQWKQRCDLDTCEDTSPVIAIRYESGKLFITLQTGEKKQTLYETNDDVKNKWLDFKFTIRFTRKPGGEINALLNGRQIVNYNGITSYSERSGFPSKSHFYFKMGLYRDRMIEPMTIYIDEYRKQKLTE